jgi:hypothetical protein
MAKSLPDSVARHQVQYEILITILLAWSLDPRMAASRDDG